MQNPNEPYTTEPLNSPFRRTNGARRATSNTGVLVGGILGTIMILALLFWGVGTEGDLAADTSPPASNTETTGTATPNPTTNQGTPRAPAQ